MAGAKSPRIETWRCAWGSMMTVRSLRRLRLGCSFVPSTEPDLWYDVVDDPRRTPLTQFELRFGLEKERTAYNLAALNAARKTRRSQVAHRSGFADLFAPVFRGSELYGVLVCGPILDRKPTAASLKDVWKNLTGAEVDPDDELFLDFVRCVLDSHLFEGKSFELLKTHIEQLAAIMAGAKYGPSGDMKGWVTLRAQVPEAAMWEVAAQLVDPSSNARWMASYRDTDLDHEGIPRMPNYAISVAPFWRDASELEAPEVLIRTHEFQRACADIANELTNTITGRVGSEAAFFLTYVEAARKERARSRLLRIGERIRGLIRQRLRIDVACGFSEVAVQGGELPIRYDQALWAAFWGLHTNRNLTFYSEAAPEGAQRAGLYGSSRLLYESFARGARRETLVAAERVVRDVLWIASGNLEVMRSHFLQILWELLSVTERREVVDQRTSSEMQASFRERVRKSRAAQDVTNCFTRLVRELLDTMDRPGELGRRAKVERARRLVESALLEPGAPNAKLDLESVAAQVGMSRSNFARAFRAAYKTTFAAFVLRSRIERSKQLLRTNLRAVDVSNEAGWSSPSYFHQAFKRLTGVTPEQFKSSAAK